MRRAARTRRTPKSTPIDRLAGGTTNMILVLCEVEDFAGLWAAGRLKARGLSVEIVTAPVVSCALRWEHRIDSSGTASVAIELGDGRKVCSRDRVGVLNRLSFVPTARFDQVAGIDRDYAVQEMNALFMSWLHALPGPMVNRPSPQGLCGSWRHRSVWAAMAHKAGLAIQPYKQSCRDDPDAQWNCSQSDAGATVFAVGERVVAPGWMPAEVSNGCRRLAAAAGVSMLGIEFVPGRDGRFEVAGATPLPDLTRGGEPLIDALQELLAA
jgi:hypothetical protein